MFSWRLHRFDSGHATLARAGDGALALQYSNQSRQWFGLTRKDTDFRQKYPAVAPSESNREDDPQCERAAKLAMGGLSLASRQDSIHGYRVLIYENSTEWETISTALAPDLGCLVMRASYRTRNAFGIPVEIGWWEVTAIRRGPPDPRLFAETNSPAH